MTGRELAEKLLAMANPDLEVIAPIGQGNMYDYLTADPRQVGPDETIEDDLPRDKQFIVVS